MSKATPGPWTVNGFGGGFKVLAILRPAGVVVSSMSRPARESEIPNARLIAAAPELLEALKDMTWDADGVVNCAPTQERVMALIAKAEGR